MTNRCYSFNSFK